MSKISAPILFSATADADASLEFYRDKLGLELVSNLPFALVFDIDGVMLRVQKVEHVTPPAYTALGFAVDDLSASLLELADKGVIGERYEFMEQDELGIWKTPDGAQVAWLKDPDGNTVSLTQHPGPSR